MAACTPPTTTPAAVATACVTDSTTVLARLPNSVARSFTVLITCRALRGAALAAARAFLTTFFAVFTALRALAFTVDFFGSFFLSFETMLAVDLRALALVFGRALAFAPPRRLGDLPFADFFRDALRWVAFLALEVSCSLGAF